MALLDEQFTETLQAGAPDITYEGNEGKEQQIAQALWDKLPPQVRMQFGSFAQFFSSGAWKKVLEMLQQQMQGREGPEEVQDPILQQEGQAVQEQGMGSQGIGGLMPQPRPAGMAYGGTPGDDGRQAYGLGSILKKITRPFKKIAKSPIGKAALIGGLGYLTGGGGMPEAWGGSGLGGFKMGNILPNLLYRNPSEAFSLANLSPLKLGAAATLAPFAMQAAGKWDKGTDEFKRVGGKFDFDYGQMREDIAKAVEAGDYENFKAVLAKYGATEGVQVGYWDTLAHGAEGGRVRAQEGGLMDLGGMEKDYRNDGGFVPLGGEEKADDVPARLSRNEFVFTADAVRNAGRGDMDAGAEVMENVMNNLEQGGTISDESQGKGAGEMFKVSERLSEVV